MDTTERILEIIKDFIEITVLLITAHQLLHNGKKSKKSSKKKRK